MAFNFLGKIPSLEEFNQLKEFVEKESLLIGNKIKHFLAEIQRNNSLLNKFKTADILLRSEFKLSNPPDYEWMTNAEKNKIVRSEVFDDAVAVQVDFLKKGLQDSIKFKLENNEFRIKKLKDLIEQHNREIQKLNVVKQNYKKTLDDLMLKINSEDYKLEIQKEKPKKDFEEVKDYTFENNIKMWKISKLENNEIFFKKSCPPIKPGDKVTLTGKVSGEYVVVAVSSYKSIVVNNIFTKTLNTDGIFLTV